MPAAGRRGSIPATRTSAPSSGAPGGCLRSEASAPAISTGVASAKAAAQAKATRPLSRLRGRASSTLREPTHQEPRWVATALQLGKGSYGAVVGGIDLRSGAPVAIKLIAEGRMKAANLEREIAILRRLSGTDHPNLVRFLAYVRPSDAASGLLRKQNSGVELPLGKPLGQHHAIVQERLDGGELFEHVITANGLDELEAAPLFAQLVDAVRAAHSLGVAHRDLKLENVLLCSRECEPGVAQRIKLIDWGLAHQHALTADGAVVPERLHSRCGSRSYMAPEVANRDISATRGYDAFAADVWSLGVCLFAIHMGFFPFEQADVNHDWRARRVVEAQRRGESTMATIFSFYPHKPLSLSRPLTALLDRMFLFEPAQRASLTEVALSDWLAPYVPVLTHQRLADVEGRRRASQPGPAAPAPAAPSSSPRDVHTKSTAPASPARPVRTVTLASSSACTSLPESDDAAAGRIERQDSASTAHSVGSSVGSSVVQSIRHLAVLDAGRGRPPHRPLTVRPASPLHETFHEAPEREVGGWDAVRYAVAGAKSAERRRHQQASADVHELLEMVRGANLSDDGGPFVRVKRNAALSYV